MFQLIPMEFPRTMETAPPNITDKQVNPGQMHRKITMCLTVKIAGYRKITDKQVDPGKWVENCARTPLFPLLISFVSCKA